MKKIGILGTAFLIILICGAILVMAQNETSSSDTNSSIVCGNNLCEINETTTCPSDCDNCSSNLQCDDGNLCNINKCEGSPKVCTHTPKNCDDNNPATIDECAQGECKHSQTTVCKNGDNYCPTGCNEGTDTDCPKMDRCSNSKADCEDGNPCTTDLCEGNPKTCGHTREAGCSFGNQCLSYGARETMSGVPQYCNKLGSWDNQKALNSLCDENYECTTNTCSQGKCMEPAKEPGIIEKIITWILTALGFVK